MNIYKIFLILFLPLVILSSCKKEDTNEGMAVGLWKQVSVTEDGAKMALTPEQEACKILIEANGICRYYHQAFMSYNNGQGPTTFYGTWSMLDGQWLNLTTDKWQFVPSLRSDSSKVVLTYTDGIIDTIASVKKQWNQYHIQSRFTILQLTDDVLEIRLKTFVGEKKYALLFAPDPEDFIEIKTAASIDGSYSPKLVTDDNYWTIRKEYQTLKTYVFTFERENY
ncbi:MAG TPA: hypothetical protein DCQ26_00630 [Marinilabiliales bacterium]|jgi:hypothetical protein|nr:MAG: hypothetical protein A2W95_17795 [Bacteroidetes bacterium GWA2_40_14]OFX61383.1 MAG: hypothetical protein A2W84_14740 [Bacteroidetes bacterium GWC2_40_13]OFX72554.1 MAG: hypothetical protein A2W96_04900 [Bacteroidetes bacterium GWD2_40_43]OFX94158.1 MAG: hypothetical protein A2W97_17710 [Bacteroidetes bacterium GWE2_40_63]OFY20310.1 MAG: hypothetical protein A2W88_12680 [Bacteroidetes bacterium GWF2_40_13]OFZ31845.1 MAG: hypothetical protein A2437_07900 [Bacteroidetes bacterium RIFOXYC